MDGRLATNQRWYVTAAAFFMNACQTGTFFFTPTALMPTITAEFGIPIALSTLPIAIGKIAYVILLIPGGILVDVVGPRLTVLVGISILALSFILYMSLVNSLALLITFHILIAASASVSGVPVYSIFIAQWFTSENLGLAMGLVLSGYSAAGTLVPMFVSPIADAFGWRLAMGSMIAILVVLALPIAYVFLHEYHENEDEQQPQLNDDQHSLTIPASALAQQHPQATDSPQNMETTVSFSPSSTNIAASDSSTHLAHHTNTGTAVTNSTTSQQLQQPFEEQSLPLPGYPTYVGFALSYLFLQYCNGCFIENIMFFLTVDCSMTLSSASIFFSTLNLAAFAAKIVGGHLGDRFNRFHVATVASGICAVGIAFLFVGGSGLDENYIPTLSEYPFSFLAFSMLYGFGYGASFNSLYALVPIVFGRKNLGRIQSSFFGAGLCGNAVGSVLTSVLRSQFASYQLAFLVAFVSCLANVVSFRLTHLSLTTAVVPVAKHMDSTDVLEEQQQQLYAGIEALDEAEEAARLRIGDASDSATEPRMTPKGSHQSLYDNRNSHNAPPPPPLFHGSDSVSNMMGGGGQIDETGRFQQATPRTLSFLNTDTPEASPFIGDGLGLFESPGMRRPLFYPDTGMVTQQGFPIPRDWSSSSLRRSLHSSITDLHTPILPPVAGSPPASSVYGPGPGPPSAPININRPPGAGLGVRRSSTLEAMIDSGILSASMETVGYLGTKTHPRGGVGRSVGRPGYGGGTNTRPRPTRVQSSVNMAQPPRYEEGPRSYGAMSSFKTSLNDVSRNSNPNE